MTTAKQDPEDGQSTNGTVDETHAGSVREEPEYDDELIRLAKHRERQLWRCLDGTKRRIYWDSHTPLRLRWDSRRPRSKHPVTTLHLMQIASHINSILYQLEHSNSELVHSEEARASLRSLLDQLEEPVRLSRDSAWELALEFERQLIELGDDTYLYTLLKDQLGSETDQESGPKRLPTIARWNDYFPAQDLERLCSDYETNGNSDEGILSKVRNALHRLPGLDPEQDATGFSDDRTRNEAREFLRHLHLVRSEEYRRDRAKIRLRARYLAVAAPLLMVLLIILCGSYILVSSLQTYSFEFLGWPSWSNPIPVEANAVPLLNSNGQTLTSSSGTPAPPSEQPMPFPAYLLLFVFTSGALGGILSRAYLLGRRSLSVGNEPSANEASIGIRALLSERKSLFAQVAMGGAAAIVIYFALQLFGSDFVPVGYGLLGFLAGYSEPFFNRMLQETAGIGQRYGGL